MKINSSRVMFTAFALGLSLQACGGAPDGDPSTEATGKTAQELSILGIPIPEPSIGVSIGDAGITINPLGTIDELLPPQGINIDPIKPVNTILGDLSKPVSVGVTLPGVELGLSGQIQFPTLPDPFGDAGIPLLTP
ncbi:MAG: hypothetical protein ACLP1X_30150 [Polyangiaceae bacterium]|jgi:hypothetical protein